MRWALSDTLLLLLASHCAASNLQAAAGSTLQAVVIPALAQSSHTDATSDSDAAQRRQLLQAAGVCPATEYFCGADDLILDSAFQALGSAACVEDTGAPLCVDTCPACRAAGCRLLRLL